MKQILLVDILAILRNNETIYLYESPNHSIGSFSVDRLLIETGKTYESVEKCAKDIGGSPTAIKDILKQQNNRVSHKGYHFKRIT